MAFYDSIKLEKGMYNQGLTKALESIDPSEAYEGTELSGLDAYERQLKRFNIKVKGRNSDVLESFFKTTDSSVLFPEFVRRSVLQGMESCTVLQSIVATVTNVESNDYRTIKSTTDATADNAVNEASDLPKTTIQTKPNLVAMKKRGRIIASSYEALRHQQLGTVSVIFRKVGEEIARAQLKDAIDVLLNGDETDNAAGVVSPNSTSGIAYEDLIKLRTSFTDCEPNVILANSSTMQDLLRLEELKSPQTILSFSGASVTSSMLGLMFFIVNSMPATTLLAIDKNSALGQFQGELIFDWDRLIERQMERIVFSIICGFAKIFTDSAWKMLYNATE